MGGNNMKIKYLFVLLTILLVVGCTTEAPETVEEETEESTQTVEEKTIEAAETTTEVVAGDEQIVLIKGPKAIEPSILTVGVGTTVTWKNVDFFDSDTSDEEIEEIDEKDRPGRAHTIAEWNGAFRSERLEPGDHFSFTFEEAGTYEYRSITAPGARGIITVE